MIRGITLRGAIALNMITMIGIGPLITIPLVLQHLAGTAALAGWILGAFIALCDGLVWAELGSQYPGSGGTYEYVRDIFGERSWGRLFAFLFNWQYVLYISLIIASGYIGFSSYAGYLYPAIGTSYALHVSVALAVGVVTLALVYRRITQASAFGVVLAVFATLTLIVVGIAGFSQGEVHRALSNTGVSPLHETFLAGLGGALYITLYDYAGYSQIALLGEECQQPHRVLPLSIVASIFIVLALYLFLQVGVLSGIPWQSLFEAHGQPAPDAQYVGSTVVAQSWGHGAAVAVTLLVLITAFASLYGNLIGAARVPYAAARDNAFLPVFARLHPRGQFPYVALLGIGVISLAACFFTLDTVIAALTAAAVLGGSIPQIVALGVMRARGVRAPFRMWLFPLPAVIAAVGWIFAFYSTGPNAMLFGTLWLLAGVLVYVLLARAQRVWPFVATAAFACLVFVAPAHAATSNATAGHKPAFVYGAAFFYERMPRNQWLPALKAYHSLGINTIDLYVMWNWHELSDGNFDFTGRTNPRRDLRALLRMIHDEGYGLILRPGPVIRNEWRNGGYPAWLLERPEYNMPMHDILEGRYPATATYQNAHSDAAAAEWLNNATHLRYAKRWLQHVYAQAKRYRDDIVSIALDDDQGAYIDNDTWPGTHFHQYVDWLRDIANTAMPGVPVFINTYQMKVTASTPVWAWGNWYQSDAYSIGEHDRAQIEFSTGLLQMQSPAQPIMISEFQAGWLQGADESRPRRADPSNTELALHSFLQMGAHGLVNFPVQDTWNPSGWEAPWANALYAWDAAYSTTLAPAQRWAPTARFGYLIRQYGAALAKTHPVADAAVAYMTSAYDPSHLSSADVAAIAAATVSAQEGCRAVRITCALVDLRYDDASRLSLYPAIVVPTSGVKAQMVASVQRALAQYRRAGGRVVSSPGEAHIAHPAAGGIPNAVLLISGDRKYAFLDIVNYDTTAITTQLAGVHSGRFSAFVPPTTVAPRSGVLLALGITRKPTAVSPSSSAWGNDLNIRNSDGFPHQIMRTGNRIAELSACAGARIFTPPFTSIGGARDAWTPSLPASSRDYIAKYTHPIVTGTFNRCYAASRVGASTGTYAYTASDAPGGPASFSKTVTLNANELDTVTRATFASARERAVQISSLARRNHASVVNERSGCMMYDPVVHNALFVTWSGAMASAVEQHEFDALLTLTYAQGTELRVRYGSARARDADSAQSAYDAFAR